jgi:hypothetical protein
LLIVTGSFASKEAANIVTAEFLAPEARNSPSSRAPPLINNLSIYSSAILNQHFVRS